jgi:predicted RNA-binding protein with PIN domain
MAAFMQAARKTDLPPSLRSLQGKHVKMLTAHRADIVSALEDDSLRALILDWLDKKPTGISKTDAAALGIAARHDDGWQTKLGTDEPASATKPQPEVSDRAAAERERTKARKARDEARRAKEDASVEVAAARDRATQLEAGVKDLTKKVRDLQREVVTARKENASLRAEIEREVRKARRRAEKAEAEVARMSKELRAREKELAARTAPAMKTPARSSAPRRKTTTEPARRARLSAPKGRFDDDPETLSEWLATPNVHLLVDGYNVSKAKGGFGDLSLETQRLRLIQELGKLARKHGITASIVFDGSDIPPGISRRARGPVAVEYSRPDEIADDHLVAKLQELPKHPVVVVTNDRELQRRTARLGATIATSDQLLKLIRQ